MTKRVTVTKFLYKMVNMLVIIKFYATVHFPPTYLWVHLYIVIRILEVLYGAILAFH